MSAPEHAMQATPLVEIALLYLWQILSANEEKTRY